LTGDFDAFFLSEDAVVVNFFFLLKDAFLLTSSSQGTMLMLPPSCPVLPVA
jgi:hypothetical protein